MNDFYDFVMHKYLYQSIPTMINTLNITLSNGSL